MRVPIARAATSKQSNCICLRCRPGVAEVKAKMMIPRDSDQNSELIALSDFLGVIAENMVRKIPRERLSQIMGCC